MPFIENQGQVRDESVRFYANTFAGTVYVTDKGEIVYSLVKTEPAAKNRKDRDINPALRPKSSISKAVVLRESLVGLKKTGEKGESKSLHPVGINKSITKVNYFIGKKENWRTGIPTWQEVSLGNVYKGIYLKLKAYGKNVEKLFTVRSEGTVKDIRLKIEGAKRLSVNQNGELEMETALGTVRMTRPVAFQEIDGRRVEVVANYIVSNSNPSSQGQDLTYGFQVGKYDKTKPLIIDPLLASTFLGESDSDIANSMSIDDSGNVYVTGWTSSSDFIVPPGAYDPSFNGGVSDAFIAKLDSNLENLLAFTFLGGSFSWTIARSIVIDNIDNVYVIGNTWSTDFPTTPGAYQTIYTDYGGCSYFISKLDSNLENLLASTFFYAAREITIGSNGNIYVAGLIGEAWSADFPVTPGAFDETYNGGIFDGFISKFDGNLENLLASTFIGGPDNDSADYIAMNSSGNVYVSGRTLSTDFPTTPGAYDTTYNGNSLYIGDIFISRLDGNLENLLSSTYLGGGAGDQPLSLTLDISGNIYVSGQTDSLDFPTTSGAYDTVLNGYSDAFISRFDSNLENLLASTFIGGSGSDYATSTTIDSSGNIYVTGSTQSPDFPITPEAYDTTYNITYNYGFGVDIFISKLNSNLENLLASTFLGGYVNNVSCCVIIDNSGNVYVAGAALTDFPTTPDAYDTTINIGDYDAFISKLDSDLSWGLIADIAVTPANIDFGTVTVGRYSDESILIENTGGADLLIGTITSPDSPFIIIADDCSEQTLAPSKTCTVEIRFEPVDEITYTSSFKIFSNDVDTPVVTVLLSGIGVPSEKMKRHRRHGEDHW